MRSPIGAGFDAIVTNRMKYEGFTTEVAGEPFDHASMAPDDVQIIDDRVSTPDVAGHFLVGLSETAVNSKKKIGMVGIPGLGQPLKQLENYYKIAADLGIPMAGMHPINGAGSPRTESGLTTYGTAEAEGIIALYDFMAEEFGVEEFINVSVSAGFSALVGATKLDTMRRGGESRVIGHTSHAPMSNMKGVMLDQTAYSLGLMLPGVYVPLEKDAQGNVADFGHWLGEKAVERIERFGSFSLNGTDYDNQIIDGHFGEEEFFFTHSIGDEKTPVGYSQHIADKSDHATLHKTPSGDMHVEGWENRPEDHQQLHGRFIEQIAA